MKLSELPRLLHYNINITTNFEQSQNVYKHRNSILTILKYSTFEKHRTLDI